MSPRPLRLLLLGYALAAAGGVAIHAASGAVLAALLAFWLGGAILVLGLALLPRPASRLFRLEAEDALEAELRRWEEDRREEMAAAASTRSRATG